MEGNGMKRNGKRTRTRTRNRTRKRKRKRTRTRKMKQMMMVTMTMMTVMTMVMMMIRMIPMMMMVVMMMLMFPVFALFFLSVHVATMLTRSVLINTADQGNVGAPCSRAWKDTMRISAQLCNRTWACYLGCGMLCSSTH